MKALILMHASQEGPGSLGEVLRGAGASLRTVKFHEDPGADLKAGDADLILSLGGPMSAADLTTHPWLAREAEFLARAVREGRKVLAVCLGAQILARGLGAVVHPAPVAEIGFASITLTDEGRQDAILCGLKPIETVLHWHRETFELPPGGTRLASSALTANQGFRVGRHAYGLQFHMEVTRSLMEEWLQAGPVRQELAMSPGAPSEQEILQDAEENEKRMRWLCHSVLNRLLNLL